ncbi:MAG TPA: decarboxylase, partial [Flavobacteriaceae bacterium]|nr:decarboxylase [Flavobacteriaceae bacterium]
MTTNAHKLELTKEEMRTLGYKAIDELVEHFDTQNSKLPVAEGSREDMDKLFL